jgi:hypothetical protein
MDMHQGENSETGKRKREIKSQTRKQKFKTGKRNKNSETGTRKNKIRNWKNKFQQLEIETQPRNLKEKKTKKQKLEKETQKGKHRKEKKNHPETGKRNTKPETEIRKKNGEIGNRNTKPETEKHCLQTPANMKIKGKLASGLPVMNLERFVMSWVLYKRSLKENINNHFSTNFQTNRNFCMINHTIKHKKKLEK